MTETSRDRPAAPPEPPIGFSTFHRLTRAEYSPCPVPDREPDFVSAGRSVYWDLGDRVVRASDHWSGQNGCGEIGGCVWTYAGSCRSGEWEVGSCPYTDFRRRAWTFPVRGACRADRELASLMRDQGGGTDPALWSGRPVPDWARIAPRGTLAAAPAAKFLERYPALARVLTADHRVIERIWSEGMIPLRPVFF